MRTPTRQAALCCHPVTLDALLERTVEEGDCRLWTLACVDKRPPIIRAHGVQHYVRRLVFELVHRKLRPGEVVRAGCGTDTCVEPLHQVATTKQRILEQVAASGAFRTPKFRMAVALGKRRRSALSEDAVRDIRYGDGPADEAAAEHGISKEYVRLIRKNHSRVDFSSPWQGLGGRQA